ncbi:sodium-coupled monocarboxylate transporter 2-like [Haliotis asinina]|uniref:sodium-coupled monocarboxylate transporter 2-like n=1 Tax=Haliotis asinina TaxID=109174 RepID=UPI003531ADB8
MTVEERYSINTGKIQTFGVADYTITVSMLVASAAIGVFYVIKDRHHSNVNEYLLGGRRMHYIPVSMSLLVTYLSALSLLGAPVEVYRNNTMLFWFGISVAVGCAVVGRIFLPFFYQLGITNVFQYLEKRFDKRVRTLTLTCFLIQALFYTSVVLYAPSLAVSAVTGFNVWVIVIVMGAVSTIYTAMGGMKAVLWTDTLQGSIMIIGCIVLVIKGSAAVGGFSVAWAIAENRSRIKIDEALGINAVGYILVYILLVMVGVIMFAFYSDCHPVSFSIIDKDDQLLPLMVMDILGDVPALPGLIISSILCGSLRYMLFLRVS